ncbi:winged helix-turn-helix domain-containing protein [Micromonospora sp. NBC_01655]|uniref:winged helix-turn-helix domain-containing protein n=1 Tax=Micromonospora sp. NBC_01655 TaxID=2975983 RepID=UPI002259F1A8|nr:winged helix-turn-helix domain-containing protein [Micromonospora sp. NBC_01655]MCX4474786.1 winged helix-turn-helix domain-containing protein [Micromonospora sp. NBC_01655]
MPRTPVYREIIRDIRTAIETGQLQPGDRLPTIAQLCEQYQASNTPVKTAMRLLEEMGLIETWQGKGMFVRQRTEDAK